jgi:hypothetical protein
MILPGGAVSLLMGGLLGTALGLILGLVNGLAGVLIYSRRPVRSSKKARVLSGSVAALTSGVLCFALLQAPVPSILAAGVGVVLSKKLAVDRP